MAIGSFVSHLKTIHAALSTLPPGAEREFIERLAEKEGIRVFPARGEMPGRLAGDRPGMRMFRERIKALFGEDAEVFVRQGAPGEFWVRLRAGEREFWVAFPRNRVDRDNTDALLYWMLAGVAIAIVATALIAWRLNRPLARLARAAEDLGKGGDPAPVPETGPSEVRAVAAAFNRMKESLKKEERERTTFLAGISHDLRTPLARLRLDVGDARGARGRGDAEGHGRGHRGHERDHRPVHRLRAQRGHGGARARGPRRARARAARNARRGRARRVACELAELPPLMLRPLAVQRLVDNLIQNAVKHAGGEILVRVAGRAGETVVSVLDRGPGIPAQDIERLKEPFTRRDEARSGRSGAGLGLAIVARIAKSHGARFDLAPREGGGLDASVAFPVAN